MAETKRKVVLVTQGTLANHNFGLLVAPTLAALAERVTNVQLAGYDPTELEALLSSMEDRGSP